MKKKSTALFTIIASSIHKLSLSIAIVSCLITASWGQVRKPEIIANPEVDDEQIKLRVRVMEGKRPRIDLPKNDFQVFVDEEPMDNFQLRKPEQTTPPPAWVIFLLDYSGSMKDDDESGKVKLLGATEAIREFAEVAATRKGETKIAVVPFATTGPGCTNAIDRRLREYKGHIVTRSLLNDFYSPETLETRIQELEEVKELGGINQLCGATDIYQPLVKAVQFLNNPEDERFNPQPKRFQPPPIQPQLSIILLSDGKDTEYEDDLDFGTLKSELQGNQSITIHTLGYGKDDGSVDKQALADIANLTNGIPQFSGNAAKVARDFIDFLNAGEEYHITYPETNPERGKAHSVFVTVKSPDGSRTPSESKEYRGIVFGRKASLPQRTFILAVVIATWGLYILLFNLLGKFLKRQQT